MVEMSALSGSTCAACDSKCSACTVAADDTQCSACTDPEHVYLNFH